VFLCHLTSFHLSFRSSSAFSMIMNHEKIRLESPVLVIYHLCTWHGSDHSFCFSRMIKPSLPTPTSKYWLFAHCVQSRAEHWSATSSNHIVEPTSHSDHDNQPRHRSSTSRCRCKSSEIFKTWVNSWRMSQHDRPVCWQAVQMVMYGSGGAWLWESGAMAAASQSPMVLLWHDC